MDEQDLQGVLPPHSVEAEQAVLGAVLIDNRCLDAVQPVLRTEDFYRHEHRTIWRVATALILAGKEADIITVFAALRVEGMADDVGGLRYLNDLAQCVPSSTKAEHYAGIVRHRAVCRRLMAVGQDLMRGAGDAGGSRDDLHALIDRIMLELIALQQGTASGEPRVVADLLPGWLDALEARSQGRSDAVPTGLHDVDRLLAGGMRPGELVVIGARPSMGKSALCLAMARNVARAGPVLVCSMEDSDMMLVSRQVAAAGRVNLADIRTPQHAPDSMWRGVAEGVDALQALPLYIDDKPALALRDVRRKAMQVLRRKGALQLVIVDYLQLMQGEGETRHQQLGGIAAGLKALAKELRCAVVLLSQLNREADKTDGPPRIDHLRESGGIEEAADIVGLLWREHRRKPRPDNKHLAQIEFAKHKNGPTDTIKLWFDGATQRFGDWAPEADRAH